MTYYTKFELLYIQSIQTTVKMCLNLHFLAISWNNIWVKMSIYLIFPSRWCLIHFNLFLRGNIYLKLLYGTENLIWEILYSLVLKLAFNLIPFFKECFWKCNQNDRVSSIIVLFLLTSYSWKSITASHYS